MAQITSPLETAAQNVTTSSTKERVALFEGSIPSALDTPGCNIAELVPEIVHIIFRTLPIYEDRKSQLAVEHAISRALKEGAFVKAFTGALVQTAERSFKNSAHSVLYKLFRWSCLLIKQNPSLLSAKTAFARLAAVQSSMLTVLLRASFPVQRASRHVAFQLVSEVADIFDCYVAELQGSMLSFENSSGLISILVEFMSKASERLEKHRAFFLELYMRLVLNSREKPSKVLSDAFRPLLQKLSHDEFGKTVVPTAMKMLKRNPELIMESVSLLLNATTLDLSKYANEFMPIILPQARHSDEGRRKEAIEAVRALAEQSSDLDTIAAMFQSIKAILGGSEGKLTFPYQRVGLINAVQVLSVAKTGNGLGALAGSISSYLMSLYKDDGNEEVRVVVLVALGVWLSKAGEALPAEAVAFFPAGLKEKEVLRRAHLRCLRVSCHNGAVPVQVVCRFVVLNSI